jgi:hypothetical protein
LLFVSLPVQKGDRQLISTYLPLVKERRKGRKIKMEEQFFIKTFLEPFFFSLCSTVSGGNAALTSTEAG